MDENELIKKLKILRQAFEKFGVSFDSKTTNQFLEQKRNHVEHEEFNASNGKTYRHTTAIKPIKLTITPLQIENSGYGANSHEKFLDWFLYENASNNPLVWENVGKPSNAIKNSFVNTRNNNGPLVMNINGQIFNGEDGNHRLLTLILNQFIEYSAAKTKSEKEAVNERYAMSLDCSMPFDADIVDALERVQKTVSPQNENSNIPYLVRNYRDGMCKNKYDNKWVAKFNPETKLFEYDFNGEHFVGTQTELLKFLKTKKQSNLPIMTWEFDGCYYVSCYNQVYKSTNKQKIDKMLETLKKKVNDIEDNSYLEIKDLDTNKYELHRGIRKFDEPALSKNVAEFEQYLLEKYADILSYKTKYNFDLLKKDCDDAINFDCGIILDELVYSNLSNEELANLKQVFDMEAYEIQQIEDGFNDTY